MGSQVRAVGRLRAPAHPASGVSGASCWKELSLPNIVPMVLWLLLGNRIHEYFTGTVIDKL